MLRPQILPYVAASPRYIGGDSHAAGVDRVIQLASNEAAFGPSQKAVAAAAQSLTQSHRYPDGDAMDLRSSLAKHFDLPVERIVCGLGSDELISLLTRSLCGPSDQIVCSAHGFLMYPISSGLVGAKTIAVSEQNRRANLEGLIAACQNTDGARVKLIFVANPNNPTGTWLTSDEITRLHSEIPSDVVLALDLAYSEYMEAPDYSNHHDLALKAENVIVLHTFSKIFGLGGLRIGWAIGSDVLIDAMNRVRGPFNIPRASQAAATAALEDEDHILRERTNARDMLAYMSSQAAGLGLKWISGAANFGLLEFEAETDVTACNEWLKAKGILTRKVASYGLPRHLRMSMGTPEEMKEVAAALREWVAQRS